MFQAKKKTFDDFVPTTSWTTIASKRKATDEAGNENAKYSKRENISSAVSGNIENDKSSSIICKDKTLSSEIHETTETFLDNIFVGLSLAKSCKNVETIKEIESMRRVKNKQSDRTNTCSSNNKAEISAQSTQRKKAKGKTTRLNKTRAKLLKGRSIFKSRSFNGACTQSVRQNNAKASYTADVDSENNDKNVCKKTGCGKKGLSCCIKACVRWV